MWILKLKKKFEETNKQSSRKFQWSHITNQYRSRYIICNEIKKNFVEA